MKRFTAIVVIALLLTVFLPYSEANCQNYDRVLSALSRLDSTVQVIKTLYMEKNESQMYADEEGMATAADLTPDPYYEFASNLEDVVNELHSVIIETKKTDADRPKNPATIGHGKIKFTGILHEHYTYQEGDNKTSTFNSKRARLGLKGKINQYASIKFLGEFASNPKLLDGVLTLSPNKFWSLNIGQFKPPFGTEFLTSATMLPFVTTTKGKKLGTDRDIGACVNYKNNVNDDLCVKLTTGVFNGSGINTSDGNMDKNVIGRAEFKLAQKFTIAPNFIIGKTNQTGDAKQDVKTFGGSVNWYWSNETVTGEYIYSEVGTTKKAGWYVWGGHSIEMNSDFFPEIQFLARYAQYDEDLDVSSNRIDQITIGTNLFIDKKYTKLQLNYQVNEEEGTSVDNNEVLANFQVAF